MRISLIGTYHAERGAVTISALLAILERIQPEVVFAEIPPTHIGAWRDGSHGTVESLAAARYAETHSIDVVPVDSPEPHDSFLRDWQELSRLFERTSPVYRRLVDLNTDRVCRSGFAYLNSDEGVQAWADIHQEEHETIEYVGSPRLRDMYARVRNWNERRDQEMLRRIHTYCAATAQRRGAFLVGAAHRKSLLEKIRDTDDVSASCIEWDLDGSQTRPG
jgi:hypothetical protein